LYLHLPPFISFYLLRMLRRYMKLKEDMPLLSGEDRGRYFGKLVFCIKTNVIYLPLPPSTSFYLLRMLRRYMKLKEDMPLLSGEDRGRYFGKLVFCIKTNVIYLPLSSSTSLYLLLPQPPSIYKESGTCETYILLYYD
ncbi:MAG: hypothetical protein J6J71_05785, partial [Prevotella sp.]|nr:hypothetical protein [Prevotella sp.]